MPKSDFSSKPNSPDLVNTKKQVMILDHLESVGVGVRDQQYLCLPARLPARPYVRPSGRLAGWHKPTLHSAKTSIPDLLHP